MAETLLSLLTAHLLGDFVFQTPWMLRRKKQPRVLLAHVATVTFLSGLFLGSAAPLVLGAVFVTHLAMDAAKVFYLKDTLAALLIDQAVHLVVIAGLAFALPETAAAGWWQTISWPDFPGFDPAHFYAGLCIVSWLVAALPLGGILIGKTMASLHIKNPDEAGGLPHGGATIGWLERGLILLLMAIHQPAGIGFLITTKSIFRFGDIAGNKQHKIAEYIIIGTFMSFAWGLLVSILAMAAIGYWMG
ncbi:MAG: DUF3307 domain-containing protein [Alphaproteobacteria bacterium]|nr:DUF3307 domain-containing protein [Alphaproteobacteria bacterium]